MLLARSGGGVVGPLDGCVRWRKEPRRLICRALPSSAAMDDPWDVKSVRRSNQYNSCMKINGVPLLPPILSKECREEMQYYKLLAKEVEKRISILKPYYESDAESCEDKTDSREIEDCVNHENIKKDNIEATIDFLCEKILPNDMKSEILATDKYNHQYSEIQDTQILIDLSVPGENNGLNGSPRQTPEPDEIPERDCDYKKENKTQKELLTDQETNRNVMRKELIDDIINFNIEMHSDEAYLPQDGPCSLSSKSFTGSLNDIFTDASKQSQQPKLIRQRSYTVLNPSPQLLAHLEVQSMNTGVEMNSISMSESRSKLSSSAKKRKSWDLASAKVKWSSMAMELKTKKIVSNSSGDRSKNSSHVASLNLPIHKPSSAGGSSPDTIPKSKVIKKTKNIQNPVTNSNVQKPATNEATDRSSIKEIPTSSNTKNPAKSVSPKKEDCSNRTEGLISELDDPASRVRELYEKLQKQQQMQMTNLIEKQKREQQLLQQVFEEQNTILLKQLKTVCPKASIEVKQAWGDLKEDNHRGPVSLSQLISTSTPDHSVPNSPVAKTLNESNSCINKCDNILKKSRDITNSIKKQTTKARTTNGVTQTTRTQRNSIDSSARNSSRKLNYDTTASSDTDTFTDRTNDTMADLNVTFPSDNSESISHTKKNASPNSRKVYSTSTRVSSPPTRNMENAIKQLENNIQNSINSMGSNSLKQSILYRQPNNRELVAATKIVACAKGFLVRRLMRTERVQSTVQTIRDALLCALQLHQDREGIRGADVDLHRRLIQQITAACYTLHDTFVSSSANERCALIAADRIRRRERAAKQPTPRTSLREESVLDYNSQPNDISSETYESNADVFVHKTFSGENPRSRYTAAQRKRNIPWR